MLKHANARQDHFPEFAGCRDAVVAQLMEAATLPAGSRCFIRARRARTI
ncbi:hypothetical protein [Methylomonas koyamae]|nr:hypothetical protein [Methylomonas koyamae]